jgi:hypothetical protein
LPPSYPNRTYEKGYPGNYENCRYDVPSYANDCAEWEAYYNDPGGPAVTGTYAAQAELADILTWPAIKSIACHVGPGCANGAGTKKVDGLAPSLIEYSHATAVYECGTSASGVAITCVDGQRIPSNDGGAGAVTFGHFVFCQGSCSDKDDSLIAHEFVHVNQWEVQGTDGFTTSYVWQSIVNGSGRGDGNPNEDAAYEVGDYLAVLWGEG